jgi:hypothetical protein
MKPASLSADGQRYRLVSLWGLMRPFRVDAFLDDIRLMVRVAAHFGKTGHTDDDVDARISAEIKTKTAKRVTHLRGLCVEAGLTASIATANKILNLLSDGRPKYVELGVLAEDLQERMIDELQALTILELSPQDAEYYNSPRKGWENLITRFPDIASDVEEAGKCFALSRYTAAVYHSVQIIESGLIVFGGFLQVSDPLSGWTAVTAAMSNIVNKKKHEERSEFERANFAFIEQMHGTVESLKNAWRNKVSHSQNKLTLMTKDFSQEIADDILHATKAFMRRLAIGLPQ